VRDAHGLGGIRAEALAGLPSVFEAGLPAYLAASSDFPAFHSLAALMQSVKDTTAVLRCGLDGLARLRRDGAVLRALLDRGDDPRPVLAAWNEEYRVQRLTMGGVADCLALVLALARVLKGKRKHAQPAKSSHALLHETPRLASFPSKVRDY
jgi:triphosphoribosyl-dephospho-CoA synthetase